MNVLALQFDIEWENKPANFEKVRRLLTSAAPRQGSLIVLPEMFATGFTMNAAQMAEPETGPTLEFLSRTAREFGVCLLGGAAILGADGRARNTALAIAPDGKILAAYAKMHPFRLGGEAAHYAAGERPMTFPWEGWKVAPFICYDLRFPESFRRVVSTDRPQLIAVMACWPVARIHHWVRLLQARAIENQACVVGVNRIGREPQHTYDGRSVIVDYHGEILAEAGGKEGAIEASLDLDALEQYRRDLPFLSDMLRV